MIRKFFRKLYKEQDGAVIVIVALFMTVLIGMAALVLDMGIAYNKKAELQKDMDSVALAAVRELPANNISSTGWINAKAEAKKYAEYNGITDLIDSDITPVHEENDASKRIIGIQIEDEIEVKYNFAKILGMNAGTVICDSTAVLKPAEGVSGLLPLAFPKDVVDYMTGDKTLADGSLVPKNITLKLGPHKADIDANDPRKTLEQEFIDLYNLSKSKGDSDETGEDLDDKKENYGTGGWRGAINFTTVGNPNGKYKKSMQDGGCKGLVNIGDEVELKPGTITVQNNNKLKENTTYPVPIIDYKDGKLVVVGFATIKIIDLQEDNKIKIVEAQFVSKDYVASGVSKNGMIENYYGVMAAKLVD